MSKSLSPQTIDFAKGIDRILNRFTPFERAVLRKVCCIRPGQVRTYEWVARQVGRPHAARAVGQVLKKNLLPFLIPCHRVIASSGKQGGYSRGIELKRAILEFERKFMST